MKRFLATVCLLAMLVSAFVGCDEFKTPKATEEPSAGGTVDPSVPGATYEFTFTSNGDGTCKITHVAFDVTSDNPFHLVFPETSPTGDRVVAIDYSVIDCVSRRIAKEDFEAHIAAPLAALLGEESFYYKQFLTYFMLKDPSKAANDTEKETMLAEYPVSAVVPIYVLSPDVAETELNSLAAKLLAIGYSHTDLAADYASLNARAKENGMETEGAGGLTYDFFSETVVKYPQNLKTMTLPASLTEINDDVFTKCLSLTEFEVPACVKQLSNEAFANHIRLESLTIPATVEQIGNSLLANGSFPLPITSVTYLGTMEQWNAIVSDNRRTFAGSAVKTVACADGSITVQ